jgi:hypothetical protein
VQLQIYTDLHELENFKKELAVVWSRYYADIWLEELKKPRSISASLASVTTEIRAGRFPRASSYVSTRWNWCLKFGNDRHVIAFANDNRLDLDDVR